MEIKVKQRLTLDRPEIYQIKVPGHLDESWSDWATGLMISTDRDDGGLPVTTMICTVDQASLQGLLSRIYAFGLPLISVICVDCI
jgi:hypothetical protein